MTAHVRMMRVSALRRVQTQPKFVCRQGTGPPAPPPAAAARAAAEMNTKSTPLNQLPYTGAPGAPPSMPGGPPTGPGGGGFVNEPHRNIITQAQAAAQNFIMPQNTQVQVQPDVDDDPTVTEALNQFNTLAVGSGGGGGGGQGPPQQLAQQQQMAQMAQMAPPEYAAMPLTHDPSAQYGDGAQYVVPPMAQAQAGGDWGMGGNTGMGMGGGSGGGNGPEGGLMALLPHVRDAAVVALLYVLLSALPIGRLLGTHVPAIAAAVPCADVLVRAALLAAAVLVWRLLV